MTDKGVKNPNWDYMGPGDFNKGVGIFEYAGINNTYLSKDREKMKQIGRLIIHVDVEMLMLPKYQFKTSKNGMIFSAADYGISSNYFGGRAVKVAEMKNEPYVLIVNDQDITVGLLVRKDRLKLFNYQELYDIARGQGLKVTKSTKKDEIIKALTNL